MTLKISVARLSYSVLYLKTGVCCPQLYLEEVKKMLHCQKYLLLTGYAPLDLI